MNKLAAIVLSASAAWVVTIGVGIGSAALVAQAVAVPKVSPVQQAHLDGMEVHQAFLAGMDAEATHTPIRYVGYGCEGVGPSGVVWGAEEDDFPRCKDIVALESVGGERSPD